MSTKSKVPQLRRLNGFTLIELMVVIVVVLVLAGLLIAGMRRAQDSSNSMKCISNLKQLGGFASLYMADNNGRVLTAEASPAGISGDSAYFWPQLLAPYSGEGVFDHSIKDRNRLLKFLCPTEVKARPGERIWLSSYAMFGSPGGRIMIGQVNNPSHKVYIGDSPWNGKQSDWKGNASKPVSFSDLDIIDSQGIIYRHNQRVNFLFHDGHVAAFAPADLPRGPGYSSTSEKYRAMFDWLY